MLADTVTVEAPTTVAPGVGDVIATEGAGFDTVTVTGALSAWTSPTVTTSALRMRDPATAVTSHGTDPLQSRDGGAQVTVPMTVEPSRTTIDARKSVEEMSLVAETLMDVAPETVAWADGAVIATVGAGLSIVTTTSGLSTWELAP